MEPLLRGEAGRRELLLGNEAIVRGALEAGVGLVSGYPGTPASEIGDTFHRLHRQVDVDFEYSVNEKVALELAFGASLTGVRSLVSMKHLGLSYGADPLSTMPYIGVVGGMVIVSAADPSCITSPNEQDQRHMGRMLGLPTLDPATPDEARRMTAWAFELSEACELPVLLRITTRVCHTRAPVTLGALPIDRRRGEFRRDPSRFVPMPANARKMRSRLQERLDIACARMTASPFNRCTPAGGQRAGPRRAVIAAGAPRNAVREVLGASPAVPLLEVGTLHPLPHDVIVPFLRDADEVLVVEELTPYLEDSLLAIAHHFELPVRLRGKRDGRMPWPFELPISVVRDRVGAFLSGDQPRAADQATGHRLQASAPAPGRPEARSPEPEALLPESGTADGIDVPARPPVLCAGCPHRNTFHAVTAVFGERAVYVNDIGCYTLGALPPHGAGDVLLAMGSSVPIAAGIARSTRERVVAFIGDSTFFHSGMPALLDAIENDDDVVLVVMDNDVTAMTGFQPNPATPLQPGGERRRKRRIADVCRALGARDVAEVDPTDLPHTIAALEKARRARGISVVVASSPCVIWAERAGLAAPRAPPPRVDAERCHTCGMSEAGLHCGLAPSLRVQRRVAVQRGLEGRAEDRLEVPRTSPCSLECPIGICIPAYVGAIAAGEPARALEAVTLRAALPSVCSHICHRPCEQACVRAERDQPIAINALKQYLTETQAVPRTVRAPPAGPRVAIVGAGPAGLAAARDLTRRGYAVTLLDARERAGGMLEHAIPAYRLPREVLRRDVDGVLAEGVRFEGNVRLGRDVTLDELRRRGFAAIVLALGAPLGSRPPLPGAELPGALDALSFLADPTVTAGSDVVVVGGGDVAVDTARTAVRLGARRVRMVFPEPEREMAAAPETIVQARAEGVELISGRAVTEARAGADGRVASVVHRAVVGFERGPAGVRWRSLELEERRLRAALLIFATGQRPDLGGLGLPAELVRPDGWIAADESGRTTVPDLFATGDVVTGPGTVTAAMAHGVRTAWAVDTRLAGAGRAVPGPAATPARPRPARHDASRPQIHLDGREALEEAQRCLLCGMCQNCDACVEVLGCPAIGRDERRSPFIEPDLCISCGACEAVCPNHAIGVP